MESQDINVIPPYKVFATEQVRFVCLSDTHGKLYPKDIDRVPVGDVLLHSGDFTLRGTPEEVSNFNTLLGKFSHPVKIVIGGNHELCLDNEHWLHKAKSDGSFTRKMKHLEQHHGVDEPRKLLTNCLYLQEDTVNISGIKIYGAPWSPRWYSDAFSQDRGENIRQKWLNIPNGIDVLMTHCPPNGKCDTIARGEKAGCEELIKVVQGRVKPKFHVFGHIHEGHGQVTDGGTTFINASICTRGYKPTNNPIVFDIANPMWPSRSPQTHEQ